MINNRRKPLNSFLHKSLVINVKLLHNPTLIDVRRQPLAFMIKKIYETYHDLLSSYAYVSMYIHFLQQCQSVIHPCLQEMEAAY